jgi:hypothetical protein
MVCKVSCAKSAFAQKHCSFGLCFDTVLEDNHGFRPELTKGKTEGKTEVVEWGNVGVDKQNKEANKRAEAASSKDGSDGCND